MEQMEWVKRNDECVVPLRKDESTAEELRWRMRAEMEWAVKAELKAPVGD